MAHPVVAGQGVLAGEGEVGTMAGGRRGRREGAPAPHEVAREDREALRRTGPKARRWRREARCGPAASTGEDRAGGRARERHGLGDFFSKSLANGIHTTSNMLVSTPLVICY